MFSALQTAIDLPLAHAFQGTGSTWLTTAMTWLSYLTAPEVLVMIALFITLYFWEHHDRRWGAKLLAVIAGNILILVLKELFGRLRPTPADLDVRLHEVGFSFPSGHALAIVLFAAVILLTLRHIHRPSYHVAWWLMAGLVGLVSWSRLYLGVHWFSDVIGGLLVAVVWMSICAYLIWPAFDRTTQRRNVTLP